MVTSIIPLLFNIFGVLEICIFSFTASLHLYISAMEQEARDLLYLTRKETEPQILVTFLRFAFLLAREAESKNSSRFLGW